MRADLSFEFGNCASLCFDSLFDLYEDVRYLLLFRPWWTRCRNGKHIVLIDTCLGLRPSLLFS